MTIKKVYRTDTIRQHIADGNYSHAARHVVKQVYNPVRYAFTATSTPGNVIKGINAIPSIFDRILSHWVTVPLFSKPWVYAPWAKEIAAVTPFIGLPLSGLGAFVQIIHLIQDALFMRRVYKCQKEAQSIDAALTTLTEQYPCPTDTTEQDQKKRDVSFKLLKERLNAKCAKEIQDAQKAGIGTLTNERIKEIFKAIRTQMTKKMLYHAVGLLVTALFIAFYLSPPGSIIATAFLVTAILICAFYFIAMKPGFVDTDGWTFSLQAVKDYWLETARNCGTYAKGTGTWFKEKGSDEVKSSWKWWNSPLCPPDSRLYAMRVDLYIKTGYSIFAPPIVVW